MVVLRGTTQSTVTPLEIMIRRLWWTPMWNFLFKKIRTRSEANNLALESLWKGKRFDRQDIFDWLLLIGLLVTLIIIFILWKTKDQMLLGRLLSLCVCVLTCGLSQTSQLQVDISSPLPPLFCHHSAISICKDVRQVCHVWGHSFTSPRKAKQFHKGGQPQRHWIAPSVLRKTAKPGVRHTREKKEAWMINWEKKKKRITWLTSQEVLVLEKKKCSQAAQNLFITPAVFVYRRTRFWFHQQ